MDFKIQKELFLKQLSWTQSIAEKKTTMPILSHVLIQAKSGVLTILSTDLEVGVSVEIPANILVEGQICIPAKNLYEIIREAPESLIHLFVAQGSHRLEIRAGRSEFKLVGLPAEEFPQFPKLTEAETSHFPVDILAEMIQKTAFAMAFDESRHNLHGLFLQSNSPHHCSIVATDTHRLAYIERKFEDSIKLPNGVIIPQKGVQELARLVGASFEDLDQNIEQDKEDNQTKTSAKNPDRPFVGLDFDARNLRFKRGAVTLIIRLIDAQFPDYRRAIPRFQSDPLLMDREALLGAVRRAALLVRDRTRSVELKFTPGFLEVSSASTELGETHEEIPVSYHGPVLVLGFNARYLLESLQIFSDPTLWIDLNNAFGPFLIRSPKDTGFFSIVMPMRI